MRNMKKITTAGTILLMTTSMVQALGLDRSAQNIGVIFEDADNYVELSFGSISPSASGVDVATVATGNVAQDYTRIGLAFKHQYTDHFSAALIIDQPYGADILYPTASPVLGTTAADLNSMAYSVIGRYELDNGFSLHGGVRAQTIDANITLGGAAYGGLNGYNVDIGEDTELGYLVGAAYERPDIALRVALTYFTAIDHSFDTQENINPGVTTQTNVTTPQAVNLDFQTGVAADTLVFGSIRWADYSQVVVSPVTFAALTGGASLTDIDSGYSYNIGVGRRFTDAFSGSLSFGYEATGDDLVSPLEPTNGIYSVALGGAYTMDNGFEISGGVRYIVLGDATPETGTPDVARASFTDNSAVAIGLKLAYSF
jgi:long-chain fatty acid transport protein